MNSSLINLELPTAEPVPFSMIFSLLWALFARGSAALLGRGHWCKSEQNLESKSFPVLQPNTAAPAVNLWRCRPTAAGGEDIFHGKTAGSQQPHSGYVVVASWGDW